TQHLEFARMIAKRFNTIFGETFVVPEQYTVELSSRIMGLDDPLKKMSKSADNPNNYIALTDSPDVIRKKFKKAVTDSGGEIKYSQSKLAIMNLMDIYQSLTGDSIKAIEKKYQGKGYADFKNDLAEIVIDYLKPLQSKLEDLNKDPDYVKEILKEGADQARKLASKKLTEVKEKMGYVEF
ncbi:MAG TPA: tryptophan--tRNA ligase, partial [Patescibacteria group bacterium]